MQASVVVADATYVILHIAAVAVVLIQAWRFASQEKETFFF